MWSGIKRFFKSYFMTGLLVLGPLAISFWFLQLIVTWADKVLAVSAWMPVNVPGFGVILALMIVLLAGFIARNFFGKYIFSGLGELVVHIPIVGAIYSGTRELFHTILGGQEKKFGRVVVVPYPGPQSFTLAFVTAEMVPPEIQAQFTEKLLSVYVPTTPNPTSGFFLYVPAKDAKPTHYTVEEAFKVIVSLGLVGPHGH
jgi:uncharacterized membrane protein